MSGFCKDCKYMGYEYNWHYDMSQRVCKHPKRRWSKWDTNWGFMISCPFWEPRGGINEVKNK
ncbi:hypothetical protein DRN50_07260 [Thermococci archaeon]|nr:MAG: hypothetical protein DRN50_07260 [Thermococci archaeon]